jgi:putative ABC transport system permease protein
LLPLLGVSPAAGRLLQPEDDVFGAPTTCVISHGLWQRAFGADPGLVGREVRLNGRPATVAGVMRPGFQFPPGEPDPPELWFPLQLDPSTFPNRWGNHFLYVLGRLKPGFTHEQARRELDLLAQRSGETASQNTHRFHATNHPLITAALHDEVVGPIRPALLMLLAAVGFVLLIACVNVGNLLLARAEVRRREIAIRRAMGAGLPVLARQLLAEGLLLALLGGAAGVGLAYGALRLIVAASPSTLPRMNEVEIDPSVLIFALLVSTGTGILFGLAPLGQLARGALNDSLKPTSGRTTATIESNRVRAVLVVAELALALVLLVGSGLMLRAFVRLQHVDVGLRPERLLTLRLALPAAVYPENAAVIQFWSDLQQRLRALPGVEAVTFMSGLPPSRRLDANDTQIEGLVPRPGGPIHNIDFYQTAGDRFFETMGIRLLEGRLFDERDGQGAPATTIVNQTMARTYYPGQSAIGRRIRPSFRDPWRTIVGVVADVKNAGADRPAGTEIYFPYRQTGGSGIRGGTVAIRTAGEPTAIVSAARAEIARLDATLPIAAVRTMEEVMQVGRSRQRFLTLLLGLFSGIALVLAAVGTYGVMSYSVAQRTSEFGIRMAIGAHRRDVLRLVLAQGLKLGGIGVGAGALGALGLARWVRGQVFGIESPDPSTLAATGLLLLVVTLAACFVPARRATLVDPLDALRYE